MPCLRAIDDMDSPFFDSTRTPPERSSGSSAENFSANWPDVPAVTRTHVESPGGVMPRSRCVLNSFMAARELPVALPTAANGVAAGTRTESYTNGASESMCTL